MGESVNVILLDLFVALVAGLIIFPACFTYDLEVGAGPSLLFDTMATVFVNMGGGRFWGSLFFLFMTFAALSTELAVFENILAAIREMTGWNRRKGCVVCGIGVEGLFVGRFKAPFTVDCIDIPVLAFCFCFCRIFSRSKLKLICMGKPLVVLVKEWL